MQASRKNDEAADTLNAELSVMYFTDPLCCWSWGFQPHLDSLQSIYDGRMSVQYIMGGMLPSWNRFHDEANSVNRPAQMGPVWMHAAQLVRRPIDHTLWIKDPPQSSFPACVAVKCAALQSPALGIAFFRKVQEAVMIGGQNISSESILKKLAAELVKDEPLDVNQFVYDYDEGNGIAAFRSDLQLATSYSVTRFPALLIEGPNSKSILISGYRTKDAVTDAIRQAFGIMENI